MAKKKSKKAEVETFEKGNLLGWLAIGLVESIVICLIICIVIVGYGDYLINLVELVSKNGVNQSNLILTLMPACIIIGIFLSVIDYYFANKKNK